MIELESCAWQGWTRYWVDLQLQRQVHRNSRNNQKQYLVEESHPEEQSGYQVEWSQSTPIQIRSSRKPWLWKKKFFEKKDPIFTIVSFFPITSSEVAAFLHVFK